MFTTRTRRALKAAGLATVAGLASQFQPAAADDAALRESKPVLTLSGDGTWAVGEGGDAVVTGSGVLQQRSARHVTDVLVEATLGSDDGTLPGPEECEPATVAMSAYGARGVEFTMIGAGDVCGVYPQPPTSIVTHVFTGRYDIPDANSQPRRLVGTDGFFEVRLADNGGAGVFAIDT